MPGCPGCQADGKKYLSDLAVTVDQVQQDALGKLGVRGPPAILIVVGEGRPVGATRRLCRRPPARITRRPLFLFPLRSRTLHARICWRRRPRLGRARLSGNRWQRVEEFFNQAAGLSPAGRAAFLDRECAGDGLLREEVESLLRKDPRDTQGNTFLKAAVAVDAGKVPYQGIDDDLSGRHVAPYRVESWIGTGGRDAVYLAVRGDPYVWSQIRARVRSRHPAGVWSRHPGNGRAHRPDQAVIAPFFDHFFSLTVT
jgi:hypothetical protein